MTFLLALKVSPSTVGADQRLPHGLRLARRPSPADVDGGTTRAIVAGAGVAAFLVFGYLALKQLPRPYLARRDLELAADDHGEVIVEPRAIERLAEAAAARHPAVTGASGRYSTDDLDRRSCRSAAPVISPPPCTTPSSASRDALEQHELPVDARQRHADRL